MYSRNTFLLHCTIIDVNNIKCFDLNMQSNLQKYSYVCKNIKEYKMLFIFNNETTIIINLFMEIVDLIIYFSKISLKIGYL